eukprot:g42086.t1
MTEEYTITMYDTKNRELRWNATYFDYSATLPDEDTEYKMLHFVSNGDGLVVTVDNESGDILWIQNYASPVVAMYIWQREGLRKVMHTNVGIETLRYLTFMSGEVGRITKWKYPLPKEAETKQKLIVPVLNVASVLPCDQMLGNGQGSSEAKRDNLSFTKANFVCGKVFDQFVCLTITSARGSGCRG